MGVINLLRDVNSDFDVMYALEGPIFKLWKKVE